MSRIKTFSMNNKDGGPSSVLPCPSNRSYLAPNAAQEAL